VNEEEIQDMDFNYACAIAFSEDYIQTLGVNFMEKTISIRSTEITFSVRPFLSVSLFTL
jgi:hypothetical protein